MTLKENIKALFTLMNREVRRLSSRRIYWFTMILAPAFCFFFFADLLKQGLPTKLPVAVVDEDHTAMSRQLARSLDAFAQTGVVMRTGDSRKRGKRCKKVRYTEYFIFPMVFAVRFQRENNL